MVQGYLGIKPLQRETPCTDTTALLQELAQLEGAVARKVTTDGKRTSR